MRALWARSCFWGIMRHYLIGADLLRVCLAFTCASSAIVVYRNPNFICDNSRVRSATELILYWRETLGPAAKQDSSAPRLPPLAFSANTLTTDMSCVPYVFSGGEGVR